MMIPSGFIFFRRVETTTQIFLITESIPSSRKSSRYRQSMGRMYGQNDSCGRCTDETRGRQPTVGR